jgi:hypothetical protein
MRDSNRSHISLVSVSRSFTTILSVDHESGKSVMKAARFGRVTRRGSAVAALLMLLCASAPHTAFAGCEHLIQSRLERLNQINQFDELIMAGSTSPDGFTQSPVDRTLPRRSSPCSGLSCSSRFPLPVSTASIATDGHQQWGALGGTSTTASKYSAGTISDESRPSTSGEITSIFHPPRV